MVPKFGKKFEDVSKLFDHAAHNGSGYLNGHCFVSLMLCVPVWEKDKIVYHSVPLSYRMWQKKESKLELASSMVRQVMPELMEKKNVISLCDSYRKRRRFQTSVLQHHISKTAADFLRMAGKSTFKPNREFPDEIYPLLVNLINIAYCAMKLLPYQYEIFTKHRNESIQDFRFTLSERIRQEVFFATFVKDSESIIKSSALMRALKYLVLQRGYHL